MLQTIRPMSSGTFPSILRSASIRTMATRSPLTSYLVRPSDLATALKSPQPPIPISAAWFLPTSPITGHASFVKSHIPESRFFDIDAISDTTSPFPHMLPSASQFSQHMSRLGIQNTDDVVLYDAPESGLFSAPRAAWTFRVFGHAGGVHVLNNYKLWVEQGLPTTTGEAESVEATEYVAEGPDESMVMGFDEVKALVEGMRDGKAGNVEVLDARSRGRWEGKDPEPRKGLSSGAMPGSSSVPFSELVDPNTKALKSREELRAWFAEHGISGKGDVVATCGTGVTAAVVEAALKEAGLAEGRRKVYDGSWTEWAQRVSEEDGLIVKKT